MEVFLIVPRLVFLLKGDGRAFTFQPGKGID